MTRVSDSSLTVSSLQKELQLLRDVLAQLETLLKVEGIVSKDQDLLGSDSAAAAALQSCLKDLRILKKELDKLVHTYQMHCGVWTVLWQITWKRSGHRANMVRMGTKGT